MNLLVDIPLQGNFKVVSVFEEAKGKFPVGSVGGFLYLDINTAFLHFVNSTLASLGRGKNKLVPFLQSSGNFRLGDFAKEICINIPNRVEVYSNSDYQVTYDTLSSFGADILTKIGMFSVNS